MRTSNRTDIGRRRRVNENTHSDRYRTCSYDVPSRRERSHIYARGKYISRRSSAAVECGVLRIPPRGLHSFALELNLSNFRTLSCVKLGCTVDRRAQVELNWERV